MSLDNLRKRLFRKNEDFSRRFKVPQLKKHESESPSAWERRPEDIIVPEKPNIDEKPPARKIFWWGLGGGTIVLIGAAIFFLFSVGTFSTTHNTLKNIALEVEGSEEVVAGKKVSWKVTYKNNNGSKLENALLIFEYPEGAQPVVGEFSKNGFRREQRDLKTIPEYGSGEEVFSALLFAPKGATLGGQVKLEYRPEDSSARFAKETPFRSFIRNTLLGINYDIPQGLQAGQEAEIKVRVVSSADTVFRGLALGLEVPGAFELTSASPKQEYEKIWLIGDLPAGGEFVLTLKGKIKKSETTETFLAQVGLYDRTKDSWAIFNHSSESFAVSTSLLSVSLDTAQGQLSPGVVQAGSLLQMTVLWRNNMPVSVHNASIAVTFEGDNFDLRTVDSDLAEYSNNALRWVPVRVPDLALLDPGDSGRFSFKVQVKDPIVPKTQNDKSFKLKIRARITSEEIPPGFEGVDIAGEAEREYKIASRPKFSQKVYYYDTRLKNTGPLPPKVGEETSYSVVWSVLNTVNNLEGVEIRATLPSYIDWKNIVFPSDARVSYKASTGELVWLPGDIPVGVGYLEPARELVFQVGFTPSLPQVGKVWQLISSASFEAEDSFTATPFDLEAREVTTTLPDDPEAERLGGRVRE